MQRRLELACALVHDPLLLVVDEPTAGLDPMLRQAIWTEFRRLRDAGRTLVVNTQYVGEAEYCDQVAVPAQGRRVALASREELRRIALGGEVVEVRRRSHSTVRCCGKFWCARHQAELSAELPRGCRGCRLGIPRLVHEVGAAGGEVTSSSEYRPTFDEVFAHLIERDDNNNDATTTSDKDARLEPVNRAA